MQWRDTAHGYGWISILLHWFAATIIIALWVLGTNTQAAPAEEYQDAVNLHTSIAVSAYVLIWTRVIWRFVSKHPGPLPKQRGVFFTLGKFVHYGLLLAISAMLISGPLMAWSSGRPIQVFSLSFASPFEMNARLWGIMHRIHAGTATFIITATLFHIGGAFKHVAINRDGTLTKMMVPRSEPAISTEDESHREDQGAQQQQERST